MKYPFMITIHEANERENIYFETEIDARTHFEELKEDKDNCFDMFLAAKEGDGNYQVIETFLNKKQHEN